MFDRAVCVFLSGQQITCCMGKGRFRFVVANYDLLRMRLLIQLKLGCQLRLAIVAIASGSFRTPREKSAI